MLYSVNYIQRMPELCEVALTAQYLMKKLKNKYITDIEIISGKYKRDKPKGIELMINKKCKIINIDSKGKFMWFELKDDTGDDIYIMNWFGMTGEWSLDDKQKSSRIMFTLSDGHLLYFDDQRNFGIIQITSDRQTLDDKINKLAPDLLKSNFTVAEFKKWFSDYLTKFPKRHNMKIINLLMRQDIDDGIASGIGNYLSSEILYRAKLSPHKAIGELSNAEIGSLAETIKMTVKMCYLTNKTGYMDSFTEFVDEHLAGVKAGTFPDYHPDIPIEDVPEFEFLVYRLKKDKHNNPVIAENIVPLRTTYYVNF